MTTVRGLTAANNPPPPSLTVTECFLYFPLMKMSFGYPSRLHAELLVFAMMKGIPLLPAAGGRSHATATTTWLWKQTGTLFAAMAGEENETTPSTATATNTAAIIIPERRGRTEQRVVVTVWPFLRSASLMASSVTLDRR